MEGNAKIIKLIARDEALHLSGTQHMLNILRNGDDDPEMAAIAVEEEEAIINIFKDAAEQEKQWAAYLFKNGSMIGLNTKILQDYVEYITNVRLKALNYPIIFEQRSNPLPWMNNWLVSDNVQVAPQESEISSYLVGQVDTNVSKDDFGGFSL
jgi:ribonucleoside-diphosphate reductase beta chain